MWPGSKGQALLSLGLYWKACFCKEVIRTNNHLLHIQRIILARFSPLPAAFHSAKLNLKKTWRNVSVSLRIKENSETNWRWSWFLVAANHFEAKFYFALATTLETLCWHTKLPTIWSRQVIPKLCPFDALYMNAVSEITFENYLNRTTGKFDL